MVPGFTTERLIEQLPVREPRRYAADDDEPEPSPSAKALTAVIVALENLPEDERWRVWQAMGHYFFPSRVSSG